MAVVRQESPDDLTAIRHVNEQVVGHILFSPVTIASAGGTFPAVGLGPMAVLPVLQRQGIGSLLVTTGLAECRQMGHAGVVVLGHPTYYPRFGFRPASRYGMQSDYAVPDDVFMALELQEGALRGRAGRAQYQPEFSEV